MRFSSSFSGYHRALPSFPTRRSSDLFLRPPTGTQLASARGLAADDKQVSGEPQQRRRALDGARGPEEALALDGIGPPRLEVGQEPARALDADEVERHEPRPAHLSLAGSGWLRLAEEDMPASHT